MTKDLLHGLERVLRMVEASETTQRDFYKYDLASIYRHKRSIFFAYRHGSTVQGLDVDSLKLMADKSERMRFDVMLDKHNIAGVLYYYIRNSKDGKFFLLDDDSMVELGPNQVTQMIESIADEVVEHIKASHPEELPYYSKKISVFFTHSELKKEFVKCCKVKGGNLMEVVKRFRLWRRTAVDEKITIGYEHGDNCFKFVHEINGKVCMVGGIIYNKDTNEWSTHT